MWVVSMLLEIFENSFSVIYNDCYLTECTLIVSDMVILLLVMAMVVLVAYRSHRDIPHAVKKSTDKFFNKTKATCGR